MTDRRTKRRYAHELYPHPTEFEVRPLSVDVPYLYAQALGYEVSGTRWYDMGTPEEARRSMERTMALIRQREIALVADALAQGMARDEAWQWAQERSNEESGEWIWERGVIYGVDPDAIRPYPCGDEPDSHDHLSERDARGFATVTRVQGKESECDECTEPVPPADVEIRSES